MRLGVHVSIEGAIDKAVDRANEIGCNTFQLFTRNPRRWNARALSINEVNTFKEKVQNTQIDPIFAHMPYLPNLASSRSTVYSRSIDTLKLELVRCRQLGIKYLVTHLGSHLGRGLETGIKRIVHAVDTALLDQGIEVMLLLENTAGTRHSMGSSFHNIRHLIELSSCPEGIGVCFDTAHAFTAGYDLRTKRAVVTTLHTFEATIGFEKLKLVHLNDSVGDFNSCIDRHEHIGMGKIGEEGFKVILNSRLGSLPLILETPSDGLRNDRDNLRKVQALASKL